MRVTAANCGYREGRKIVDGEWLIDDGGPSKPYLSPAQWLPKPATSQFPHKRRTLRDTWSLPFANERAGEGMSEAKVGQVGTAYLMDVAAADRRTDTAALRDFPYLWIQLATEGYFDAEERAEKTE